MIAVEALKKSYDEFQMELDLRVETGELVSVLGPSGSGKTTTLRLVAGFESPDSGRILVNGVDVTSVPPARRQIGYVFQDYTLFPHMSVAQNIGYGLRIRRESAQRIGRRVDELLELMELPGYGDRRVDTLSGGERQRVAIARALAVDPVLLMLDEPFSSIDEVLRRDLRREIVRLQKELSITVLFVTHSRQEALSISDRVAILRHGRLVQFASPMELYRDPVDDFVAGFVGERSRIEIDATTRVFRPEELRILLDDGATTPGAKDAFPIPARITNREFLGFAWLYEMQSDAGTLLAYDVRRIDRGASVVVTERNDGTGLLDAPR